MLCCVCLSIFLLKAPFYFAPTPTPHFPLTSLPFPSPFPPFPYIRLSDLRTRKEKKNCGKKKDRDRSCNMDAPPVSGSLLHSLSVSVTWKKKKPMNEKKRENLSLHPLYLLISSRYGTLKKQHRKQTRKPRHVIPSINEPFSALSKPTGLAPYALAVFVFRVPSGRREL